MESKEKLSVFIKRYRDMRLRLSGDYASCCTDLCCRLNGSLSSMMSFAWSESSPFSSSTGRLTGRDYAETCAECMLTNFIDVLSSLGPEVTDLIPGIDTWDEFSMNIPEISSLRTITSFAAIEIGRFCSDVIELNLSSEERREVFLRRLFASAKSSYAAIVYIAARLDLDIDETRESIITRIKRNINDGY